MCADQVIGYDWLQCVNDDRKEHTEGVASIYHGAAFCAEKQLASTVVLLTCCYGSLPATPNPLSPSPRHLLLRAVLPAPLAPSTRTLACLPSPHTPLSVLQKLCSLLAEEGLRELAGHLKAGGSGPRGRDWRAINILLCPVKVGAYSLPIYLSSSGCSLDKLLPEKFRKKTLIFFSFSCCLSESYVFGTLLLNLEVN